MKIQIKHKHQDEVLITLKNAETCGVCGEFFYVENTESLKVGQYNLLDFDFEVTSDD